MKQSTGVNSGYLMGYIPIRWKGSGLSLNAHGMAHIIIIQQVTRHCISQMRATRTTTEEGTSLPSFSQRVWRLGKLKISQVQKDLFRNVLIPRTFVET